MKAKSFRLDLSNTFIVIFFFVIMSAMLFYSQEHRIDSPELVDENAIDEDVDYSSVPISYETTGYSPEVSEVPEGTVTDDINADDIKIYESDTDYSRGSILVDNESNTAPSAPDINIVKESGDSKQLKDKLAKCDKKLYNTIYYNFSCYEKFAEYSGQSTICNDISDIEYRDRCYNGFALNKLDYTLCQNVETDKEPTWFKFNCYANIAVAKDDFKICNKQSNKTNVDWCYSMIIMETGEYSRCYMISDSEIRDDCYLNPKNFEDLDDVSRCSKIQNSTKKDMCIEIGEWLKGIDY